jgi:hypothetical protein
MYKQTKNALLAPIFANNSQTIHIKKKEAANKLQTILMLFFINIKQSASTEINFNNNNFTYQHKKQYIISNTDTSD